MTVVVCQETSAVLHCPQGSVINVQSAFYGRRSADICPQLEGSLGGAALSHTHKKTQVGERKCTFFLEYSVKKTKKKAKMSHLGACFCCG